jgi:MFS family permease
MRMRGTAESPPSLARFAPALSLLALAIFINYIDRGNIGIAAPLLQRELGLSDGQLGLILSAFFWTYTLMQFLMGWLVDRWDASRILAAGFLLWSLATAATGLVHGFALVLAMRMVLGLGESVAFPASSKILAQHLPEHHRGFASGVLMSALRMGNALGTLISGHLMATFGWRPVFLGAGLVSLLWLPGWAKWVPRSRAVATQSDAVRGLAILARRSFWGTSAGHFSANYLLYFMVTWLPSYLVRERHLSLTSMATIAGLYYTVDAAGAIVGGAVQDFLIRRGCSLTRVRKSAMAGGFFVAALSIMAVALTGSRSYLPWLLAVGAGCGMTGPGLFTFPQTLAGPLAVGRWYGWQNGFANLAGVIAPALTGFVVERTGNFLAPLAITATVCVAGALAMLFVVGRVAPVRWTGLENPVPVPLRAGA